MTLKSDIDDFCQQNPMLTKLIGGACIIIIIAAIAVGLGMGMKPKGFHGPGGSCGAIKATQPYDYKYFDTQYKGNDCGCGCDGMKKAAAAKTAMFGPAMQRENSQVRYAETDMTNPRALSQTSIKPGGRNTDISSELSMLQESMNSRLPGQVNTTEYLGIYAKRAAKGGTFTDLGQINSHIDSKMNTPRQQVPQPSLVTTGSNEVSDFRGARFRKPALHYVR